MSAIRIYVAMSVDGFIADSEGGVDFLDGFDPAAHGFNDFFAEVGAVLMGRRTYELVRAIADWPYGDKRTFVLASQRLANLPRGTSQISSGLAAALAAAREATQKDIWIVGGATTMTTAIEAGVVDSIEIFKVPVLLGRGLDLLPELKTSLDLGFEGIESFRDGVVKLRYVPRKPGA